VNRKKGKERRRRTTSAFLFSAVDEAFLVLTTIEEAMGSPLIEAFHFFIRGPARCKIRRWKSANERRKRMKRYARLTSCMDSHRGADLSSTFSASV